MGEVTEHGSGHEDRTGRDHADEQAVATAQAAPTSVEPVTPQDTHAAGAATATQNQLLQGNVSGSQQKGAAEKASELADEAGSGGAGYHSTGSFTGTSNK
jgi:hypothetical protein